MSRVVLKTASPKKRRAPGLPQKRRGPPLALVGDRDPLASPGAALVLAPLPLPAAAPGPRFRPLVSIQLGRLRRRRSRSRASRLPGTTRPGGERPGPSRLPWWRCRPWVQRSPRRVVRAGACRRPLDPSGWCRASLDHSPAPQSPRPVCSPCLLARGPPKDTLGRPPDPPPAPPRKFPEDFRVWLVDWPRRTSVLVGPWKEPGHRCPILNT
jgi:hypothetical protein